MQHCGSYPLGKDSHGNCCIDSWEEMHPNRRYIVDGQKATGNGQGAKLLAGLCIAVSLLVTGFLVGSLASSNAIEQGTKCMEGCN